MDPKQRIQSLKHELANQIAAGEVVERPSSVVKELIENSLDAGATQIDIMIERGGKALIQLVDNGHGIHPDDLQLAFQRHATSKICSQQDLLSISSLGFRGEALASIASIASVSMISCYLSCDEAWEISFNPSPQLKLAPHPTGTTVRVKNLFEKIPARQKFLRSDKTEYSHIETVVKQMVLARPDVTFSLSHNSGASRRFVGAKDTVGLERRIKQALGSRFLTSSYNLEIEATGLGLKGWVTKPHEGIYQSDKQFFYINGRIIKDRVIGHAIRQSYTDYLSPGQQPSYCLYLTCDPKDVDVNVHPTKHEVRFLQARLIHDFITSSLHRALGDQPVSYDQTYPLKQQRVASPVATYAAQNHYEVMQQTLNDSAVGDSEIELLGQVEGRYLLQKKNNHLVVTDLKHLLSQLLRRDVTAHSLLFPTYIQLTASSVEKLLSYAMPLSQLGFEIDRAGDEQVVIRSVPDCLKWIAVDPFIKRLVHEFVSDSMSGDPDLIPIISNIAVPCDLTGQQQVELLQQAKGVGLVVEREVQLKEKVS